MIPRSHRKLSPDQIPVSVDLEDSIIGTRWHHTHVLELHQKNVLRNLWNSRCGHGRDGFVDVVK